MAPFKKSTVVVGLDFGTTYSGFAWALRSEPEKVNKFYEWPDLKEAGGRNYCKTVTSLQYLPGNTPGSYVLQDYAYSALAKHCRHLTKAKHKGARQKVQTQGHGKASASSQVNSLYFTKFKLHLASWTEKSPQDLPPGLTPSRLISDYLWKLGELIMKVLKENLGDHITMKHVQWCLTVPAIWEEASKQQMITCAEMAGLVDGPNCSDPDRASRHPCVIVLEPEAASFYCQRLPKRNFPIDSGEKFLVVDIGGGTVDLVLHEKIGPKSTIMVKEVSASSGDLCGGTYVDAAFLKFLSEKISCFQDIIHANPSSFLELKGKWEDIKYRFDGSDGDELELPGRIARAWRENEQSRYSEAETSDSESYEEIYLALEDMCSIFDPVVNDILKLINEKWVPNLKAMMLVGGFAGSPYLVKRIREKFESKLGWNNIVIPNEPGSAICCGAVVYGLHGPDIVSSRIAKRTYGIVKVEDFVPGVHPNEKSFVTSDGKLKCNDIFDVFTRKGDVVPLNHEVVKSYFAASAYSTNTTLTLYSTLDPDPKFITGNGVRKEGHITVPHPAVSKLGEAARFQVTMRFGTASIEVKVVGKNFEDGETHKMVHVIFDGS